MAKILIVRIQMNGVPNSSEIWRRHCKFTWIEFFSLIYNHSHFLAWISLFSPWLPALFLQLGWFGLDYSSVWHIYQHSKTRQVISSTLNKCFVGKCAWHNTENLPLEISKIIIIKIMQCICTTVPYKVNA